MDTSLGAALEATGIHYTLVGGAVASWPLAVRAQQPAMPVVGFVNSASPGAYPPVSAFLDGLGESGFVEGRDMTTKG